MSLDPQLAQFQSRLLTALVQGVSPAEVRERALGGTADTTDLADWVGSWEDDMLELAALLVQTWARPQGPQPQ